MAPQLRVYGMQIRLFAGATLPKGPSGLEVIGVCQVCRGWPIMNVSNWRPEATKANLAGALKSRGALVCFPTILPDRSFLAIEPDISNGV